VPVDRPPRHEGAAGAKTRGVALGADL